MKGLVVNLDKETRENSDYRRVVYTASHTQLVLMSLKPGEEIGNEVHSLDQFIRIEQGQAKVILQNGETEYNLQDDWAVIIPAGTYHNVINTGKSELKLYTLYSPPEHQKDTVQSTKEDEKEEHFDGKTSEND
ncbi:cupin [Candidatus Roizmanbacteria bacterium RIFCSPHIGHO2_02_FULL_37_15]|uniref:Cupin n=1 Tax=Candidatus Roizmanbacteria bacterium RIFCSPLOWO2_01_FULL_37_16 TaxID=1802058 RepID=A0A1F7IIB5_9BACT|nr:MAG: cupin [Candidatus Roizmanbacteria bacterium RIFCSPHIGHO2_01_FULL_37_16b]OGK22689.1 MAG: cupin [Candidatus Roizmanbacteria bacterium RIFCSPHIGHO2_02_FULL_37_15]OGK32611.1 MAG: cupin [Candidatus Roizmanbacteria bacterium RIFCSPHIGHO2_12_FULL_36_11]OGK43084.1 MAG: cupin [Candidatus Roizmanbacteria bacterium RIFCSPLOWO2_01_FULL_37_16]OGK55847.1 MAG: cupin [Candidatus Roizmanbacteria bacterium RIFCSPLOWO2_02_FULL_37_9]